MAEKDFEKLSQALQIKVNELLESKSKLEFENGELRSALTEKERELQEIRVKATSQLIESDVKKLILKEFARNKSTLSIHKELGKLYNISLDEIEEIVKNIDKLDIDLIEYYKSQVEFYKNNDLIKFLSEQDLFKDSVDFTLINIDKQLNEFSKLGIMDKDEFNMYDKLLGRKKDFLNTRLKLIDTYKEENTLNNSQKENSNSISVEIKKEITNIMNINNLKDRGIKVIEVDIDEEVGALN